MGRCLEQLKYFWSTLDVLVPSDSTMSNILWTYVRLCQIRTFWKVKNWSTDTTPCTIYVLFEYTCWQGQGKTVQRSGQNRNMTPISDLRPVPYVENKGHIPILLINIVDSPFKIGPFLRWLLRHLQLPWSNPIWDRFGAQLIFRSIHSNDLVTLSIADISLQVWDKKLLSPDATVTGTVNNQCRAMLRFGYKSNKSNTFSR